MGKGGIITSAPDPLCSYTRVGGAIGSRATRTAAARRRGVALKQGVLGFGVEGGGGFVEHQQQRAVAHEAGGQGQLLPLWEKVLKGVEKENIAQIIEMC